MKKYYCNLLIFTEVWLQLFAKKFLNKKFRNKKFYFNHFFSFNEFGIKNNPRFDPIRSLGFGEHLKKPNAAC